jgi:hypothetical protein
MKTKRVLAAILWFYVTWYAWAMFAAFAGLSDIAGPILGLAAAVLFAGDPMHRIWNVQKPVEVAKAVPEGAHSLV